MNIGELLAELFDLTSGFEVLECMTNGHVSEADSNGAESGGVELGVSLHDVERALWGEGVVIVVDTGDDFTLFGLGVNSKYKRGVIFWASNGGDDRFWSRRMRGSCDGAFDEGDFRVGDLDQ